MSGSTLDEQNLVLYEVFVLCYSSSGQKVFGTQDKVLRAVILRTHLQQEVGSGDCALICMDTACAKFAPILFQYQGLCAFFRTGDGWVRGRLRLSRID
jgi:hypothetical protein